MSGKAWDEYWNEWVWPAEAESAEALARRTSRAMGIRERRERTCPRRAGPTIFWLPVVDKLRTFAEIDPETVAVLSLRNA